LTRVLLAPLLYPIRNPGTDATVTFRGGFI
jgi:hypothetical protein